MINLVAEGRPGRPGTRWHAVTAPPDAELGIDGDYAINLSDLLNIVFYRKAAGAWSQPIRLTGQQGVPGEPGPPGHEGPLVGDIPISQVAGLQDGLNLLAALADVWTRAQTDARFVRIDGADGPLDFRNRIINGDFALWQRGTSYSGNGYSADRWVLDGVGGTKTVSQIADSQALGPYAARFSCAGGSAASDREYLEQKVESVYSFAGRSASVSLDAVVESGVSAIAVELIQNFGTSGSAAVVVAGKKFSLTTAWQRFKFENVSIPGVGGKTIGAGHHLLLRVWMSAGSTYNARTETLGPRTHAVQIKNVQVEEGARATPFIYRPPGVEELLAWRYYYKFGVGQPYVALSSTTIQLGSILPVKARATPTISISATPIIATIGSSQTGSGSVYTVAQSTRSGFRGNVNGFAGLTAGQVGHLVTDDITVDAEL